MRGGPRKGAGRKKGQPNRKTSALKSAAASAGLMPVDYMLGVMRNGQADPHRRDEMAKAAAPYLHPRLAAVEHTGKDGGPIQTVDWSKLTDEQFAACEPLIRALAGAADPAGPVPGRKGSTEG